eukprot:236387-Chlamydomonas_euryale.AAC.2
MPLTTQAPLTDLADIGQSCTAVSITRRDDRRTSCQHAPSGHRGSRRARVAPALLSPIGYHMPLQQAIGLFPSPASAVATPNCALLRRRIVRLHATHVRRSPTGVEERRAASSDGRGLHEYAGDTERPRECVPALVPLVWPPLGRLRRARSHRGTRHAAPRVQLLCSTASRRGVDKRGLAADLARSERPRSNHSAAQPPPRPARRGRRIWGWRRGLFSSPELCPSPAEGPRPRPAHPAKPPCRVSWRRPACARARASKRCFFSAAVCRADRPPTHERAGGDEPVAVIGGGGCRRWRLQLHAGVQLLDPRRGGAAPAGRREARPGILGNYTPRHRFWAARVSVRACAAMRGGTLGAGWGSLLRPSHPTIPPACTSAEAPSCGPLGCMHTLRRAATGPELSAAAH